MKKIIQLLAAFALIAAPVPALASAQTTGTAPNSPSGTGTSHNWAGYAAMGGNYTAVSGNWTVPQPQAAPATQADATWIGIGGVSGRDLIQAGTQAVVQNNGVAYQAWYEILPANSITVNITVNPGDLMAASIAQQSAGVWLISLRDLTSGQSYQTTVDYNSSQSSAEWIEEMPSSNFGFIPLDNFGVANFSNASVAQAGSAMNLAQAGAQVMNMVNDSGQALTAVSPLNPDGASFSVTRTSVASDVSTGSRGYGRRGWQRVGQRPTGFRQFPRSTVSQQFGQLPPQIQQQLQQLGQLMQQQSRMFRRDGFDFSVGFGRRFGRDR